MEDPTTNTCANCQRMQAQLDAQQAQIHQLTATLVQLQSELAVARKNSSTSSKPPSSDIVKPPKPDPPPGQDRRRRGGQLGHPKHERLLVPPALLTEPPHDYFLEIGRACGHGLQPAGDDARVVQHLEIPEVPLLLTEHRSHPGWCRHCCTVQYAEFPPEVASGGLVGPRLSTLIAYLKGACHASYSTIRQFLRDVLQVRLARGQLAKIIRKVSTALEQPDQELLANLPLQAVLNIDETSHQRNGDRWWTWCFCASLYTLFKIDPTRSADVLIEVLGEEFQGVIGCDYYSAYRRSMREFGVLVQFCLAHLVRDVKFLLELPNERGQAYGRGLRDALRQLFAVIHQGHTQTAAARQAALAAARQAVLPAATASVPDEPHCRNLAKRFTKHGDSYLRFITTPGVEPTNNVAEQAIRFVVLDRVVTQGTRSEVGDQWCERIWTVIATCAQQGRSVFGYL